MRTCRLAVYLASVAWIAGCSQSFSPTTPQGVSAAGAMSNAAQREVPFMGSLEGAFTFTPEPPPSTFASVSFAPLTGTATHLGAFRLSGTHRVNLATTVATAVGTFEFTAANGDTLTASFTGLGSPTAVPGIASIVETATITGGTGRFAEATGSFVVERVVDLINLRTTGSFKGTITW